MHRLLFRPFLTAAICLLAPPLFAEPVVPLTSGIDRSTADPAVRIQDDAYRAAQGRWMAETQIPPDRISTGVDTRLYDQTLLQLRGLIEAAAASSAVSSPSSPGFDADVKKIGDLYASFMDEAKIEALGVRPIAADLARIDALRTAGDVSAWIAESGRLGAPAPVTSEVHQDAKDSSKYVFDLEQGGLGLPDRDYYLAKGDRRFADVRAKYAHYLAKMLTLVDEPAAADEAGAIVALETAIARAQWTRVQNRDPVKIYNVVPLPDLPKLAPHIDWSRFVDSAGLTGKLDSFVVSQPTYLEALDRIVATTPIATWRAYFKTRYLETYARYLGPAFVDTRFAFFGTVLNDVPQNTPRWKRGVQLIEPGLGESLGRLYVATYFRPESKARMDRLVRNLLAAYRTSIDQLTWMGADTKTEARAKLAILNPKIGYPARWRDYAALKIDRDDLVGNVQRANAFEYERNVAKLGRPIDREEWAMTPQTINAYYDPEKNEIVFPAAYLQAPFFDPQADDAANYGAVGATIGHEISHGFDDQGSQYDGHGNLRDWWTPADRKRFAAKTKALVAQFNAFSPVPGYHVDGALTLGENIADLSGLAIAYKAYRNSLDGKESPVIDGMTGDQRFFLGYIQSWQEKTRDAAVIAQIKSDPHAPGEFRADGSLANTAAFYDAFDVKPGDRMYRAPAKRVIIW